MTDKKSMWNDAGRAGLVLGGVSVAYLALTALTGKVNPDNTGMLLLAGGANMILWVVKFVGCILLMRYFLKKRYSEFPESGSNEIFKYGCAVALLSSIVYSACYLAYMQFIAPEMFENTLELLKDNPMMDSNSLEAMDQIMPKMPMLTFFFNLIYCWLFGTVLSAIFSKRIAPDNPFK